MYKRQTYGGGGNCTFGFYTGCGMIYQLTPNPSGGAWTENILWQFQGGVDGGLPGALMLRNSKLYGVASIGGGGDCATGCGYIFELAPPTTTGGPWTKTALYDFPTVDALCGLTAFDAAGNYYGVAGSANGNGSVCEMTPPATAGASWTERILYVFKGVAPGESLGDGSGPLGVTRDSLGNLWGATVYGGYCQQYQGGSCFGALFVLRPPATPAGDWTESVVYRFRNDDENPSSGVVLDKNGALYGITYVEAYKFFDGALTVIGSFSDIPPNGYSPTGGVILDRAGNVYGTTGAGGQFGKGTVYELTAPTYARTTLHSFAAGGDGWNPIAPLTFGPHGKLFGTTQIGGNQGCLQFESGGAGCGTVFEVIP